jgi:hypothetical protein
MNRDSDITSEILWRLLFEPFSEGDWPSGVSQQLQDHTVMGDARADVRLSSMEPSDLADLVALDGFTLDFDDTANPHHSGLPHLSDPGDVSVVQNHFEALLKRRLQEEIQHRPPLFPWEKDYQSYPDILSSEPSLASIWLDHLKQLEVPCQLPDDVLATLLKQCQQIAQHTRQTGRRLVEAVEVLFPNQPQQLDRIAGLVARPAYRSAPMAAIDGLEYQSADPQQQIALSMLTAKSILEALTLSLSAAEPTITREWLTPEGKLVLRASYQSAPVAHVEMQVELPAAGTIVLGTGPDLVESQRSAAGALVVRLDRPQPGMPYPLTVTLADHAASPLQFTLLLTDR